MQILQYEVNFALFSPIYLGQGT